MAGGAGADPGRRGDLRWYDAGVERRMVIVDGFEAADRANKADYAAMTPQARLDLLLELIRRYRESLGEAADRFERVHRIAELSRG